MKNKTIVLSIVSLLLVSTLSVISPMVVAEELSTIRGYTYLEGSPAAYDSVVLFIGGEEISNKELPPSSPDGYYAIDVTGHVDEKV